VEAVQNELKSTQGLEATKKEIAAVMKDDFGLSWRKVKPISLNQNSTKNLVLR